MQSESSGQSPTCYVCGNPAGSYFRQADNGYQIIKRGECGLEYTLPNPTEAALKQFYAQYHGIRADSRIVELNAREHLRMLEKYGWTPVSRTLDFGAGEGVFVQVAGANCYGVEWGSVNNSRIKQTLNEFGDAVWDFITLWGVLEHLGYPNQVVSDLASSLQRGGDSH